MSDRAAALLNQLEAIVRREAWEQRERLERQWSLPLEERVRTGKAIEGLRYAGINEETGNFAMTCPTNHSRFREGDHVFLHRGRLLLESPVEAILELDDEQYLEFSSQGVNLQQVIDGAGPWIADEGYLDLSSYYLQALAEIADREVGRTRILPLVLGDLGPGVDYGRYERGWAAASDAGLNESQAEAVGQAYATGLVHLIQGPPGTGKTVVLAHLARLLVEEGERVLVTALTHRAINNALNKIAQVASDLPACKIGPPACADDLLVSHYLSFDQSRFGELSGGYVIGATPFATCTDRLGEVEFDTVLFDESSQITLPLAMMGMLVGKRYVFVGDDQQLPPVAAVRDAPLLARTSIFGYLVGRGYETMLTQTYRLNDVLAAWPSRRFYANLLQPAPTVGERRLSLGAVPGQWQEILDPAHPAVWVDLQQRNTTVRSRREADVVAGLVRGLLAGGVPAHEIGVISPYRAQGRQVRSQLRRSLPDPAVRRAIIADTVERMQGQEREVILVSLATSSPHFAAQLADFFFQPQRINVTVTRPRTKLIIVGSRSVLQVEAEDPELCEWVHLFRDMAQSCTLRLVGRGTS
ncbi:MAG: AAA family ATPase [Anaerolineae bacterium]|nr:AAA family ATPase [Anaerolineae bacterium]